MTDWFKPKAQVELEKEIPTKRKRERELQSLLDKTDHKEYPSYEAKEGEDLESVIANRKAWRAEIREVQAWLEANAPDETD